MDNEALPKRPPLDPCSKALRRERIFARLRLAEPMRISQTRSA
jgi:hypothetical protein